MDWPAWLTRLFWWRKRPAGPTRPLPMPPVYRPPRVKGNRQQRRYAAYLNRPKRGTVKAKLRREHIERMKSPRQRVLARLTNSQITWWHRDGRSEEQLIRWANAWSIE